MPAPPYAIDDQTTIRVLDGAQALNPVLCLSPFSGAPSSWRHGVRPDAPHAGLESALLQGLKHDRSEAQVM
jgi:hypothetical protein